MVKKIFLILFIIVSFYGCYKGLQPEIMYEYFYEEGYDITTNGPVYTNWRTNKVLIISNIIYTDKPTDPVRGKAKMDGIYLTSPYGTYNGAKVKTVNEVTYWAVGVGDLFFQHNYFNEETMKIMGNIYAEKCDITFLSNHTVSYGAKTAKTFRVTLRGSDYRHNYSTNYVTVYSHGMEANTRHWINNISSRGHHLTYIEWEDTWYGKQHLVRRFKNGETSWSAYNVKLPKAGRNTYWRNWRNNKPLATNPYHDLWLVRAYSPTEAIFVDSFTGDYVGLTIKWERQNIPRWMGIDNQNNPEMRVLSVARPKTAYQGQTAGRYSVINGAWKNAMLVAVFTLTENYAQITANVLTLLYNGDFKNGNYENRYAKLSWTSASADGWLYNNYYWGKNEVEPWGFMMWDEFWEDEHGQIR